MAVEPISDGSAAPIRPTKKVQRIQLTRYDQALRSAKNSRLVVKFSLTMEVYFADEDFSVIARVIEVDKYDILVQPLHENNPIWLKKSAILATEVLR